MTAREFWTQVAISAGLTPVIKLGATAFGIALAWWLAAAVALVLVFGGVILLAEVDS